MKKLMVLLLALPMLAWAQSPFNGTWKVNANTAQLPQKPHVFVIQNGMFQCKTCVPAIDIKADGQWHKVTGHPYFDEMMVKVVSKDHVEQATKKDGKEVGSESDVVSNDGKTLTVNWVDKSAPNGKEVTGQTTLTRVAAGPAGSNPLSGSWRDEKVADISPAGLTFTYKSIPGGMSYSTPTGESYTAKFGGSYVPIKGDPANTMVSIKKLGPDSIQETNKRDGKVVSVATMTVNGDQMTLHLINKLRGTNMSAVAQKE